MRAEPIALEERVAELLQAGWQRVSVITDHGWLMLPGGLPKVDLPENLTLYGRGVVRDEARCAGESGDGTLAVGLRGSCVALAPGIACFEAGVEYEHGGLARRSVSCLCSW